MTVHDTAARPAMPSARSSTRSPVGNPTIPHTTGPNTCLRRSASETASVRAISPPGGDGGRARRPCGLPSASILRSGASSASRTLPAAGPRHACAGRSRSVGLVEQPTRDVDHARRRVTSLSKEVLASGPPPLAFVGGQRRPASSSRKRRNARRPWSARSRRQASVASVTVVTNSAMSRLPAPTASVARPRALRRPRDRRRATRREKVDPPAAVDRIALQDRREILGAKASGRRSGAPRVRPRASGTVGCVRPLQTASCGAVDSAERPAP